MTAGPRQKYHWNSNLNFDSYCHLCCLKKDLTMDNALILTFEFGTKCDNSR